MLVVLVLVTFALGYVGFQKVKGLTAPDCVYDTLQLFAFKYDSSITTPSWELNAARFLAFGISLYAAALALSVAFRDEFEGLRARLCRNHVVVCGLGSTGALTAISFQEHGSRVVGIEANNRNPNISRCRRAGSLVLKGDARDTHVLRKARLARASHLVVMCGSDEQNAEVVAAARSLVEVAGRAHRRPLRCIVEIVDFDLGSLLTEASLAALGTQHFRLEFFHIAERGAQAMLQAYPAFDDTGLVDGGDPHILMVGVGEFGSSLIALATLRWGYLRPGERLRITVVDRNAQQNVHAVCARYPGLREGCAFNMFDRNVSDPNLWHGTDFAGLPSFTTAYVCLREDSVALTAGLGLQRSLPPIPIVVRTTQHPNLSELLARVDIDLSAGKLHTFDVLDHVCDSDALLEGPFEQLARAIHARHVASQEQRGLTPSASASIKQWDETREEFKESSRRNAEHIAVKLRTVGLGIVRFTDWDRPPLQLSAEDVETMATLEHKRWCEERHAEGWTYGSEKDVDRKLHPDLVPWDDLAEPEREYDRALVRAIPEMLASIGFAVVPVDEGLHD